MPALNREAVQLAPVTESKEKGIPSPMGEIFVMTGAHLSAPPCWHIISAALHSAVSQHLG